MGIAKRVSGRSPISIKVEGGERLRKALQKEHARLGGKYKIAVYLAGKAIEKEANYYVPYDPTHDPGDESKHLRGSSVVVTKGTGFNTVMGVGYTDPKAVFVHEDPRHVHGMEYNIKYRGDIARGTDMPRRPQEKYKWLEDVVDDWRSSGKLARFIQVAMHV